ncbi:MAG: hypothetical protein OEZ06_31060 [Myxococcales bacterium]|nr:hypothetical protein [Myxococcales bacterium]
MRELMMSMERIEGGDARCGLQLAVYCERRDCKLAATTCMDCEHYRGLGVRGPLRFVRCGWRRPASPSATA